MRQFKNIKFCGDVTPERLAETQRLVDAGVMASTRHPDEAEAMALFRQQQEHGVGWGLRQLLIREGILDEQRRRGGFDCGCWIVGSLWVLRRLGGLTWLGADGGGRW